MNVNEARLLFSDFHPREEVALWNVTGHRYMKILGVNRELSQEKGCLVLDVDWSVKNHVVESEHDKLIQQKELIEKALELEKKEKEAQKSKPKKKKKKQNRTASEQIKAGFVPTGKRGRPRKIREDAAE